MRAKVLTICVVFVMVLTGFSMLMPTSEASMPLNVTISNVTAGSFAVTWTTTATEDGQCDWWQGGPQPVVYNSTLDGSSVNLHSIQATGLVAGVVHSLTIWSEGQEYGDSDGDGNPATGFAQIGGVPWRVTTLTAAPGSGTVYGHVSPIGGVGDAVGANVIITVGGNSYSDVTDASGDYVVDVFGTTGAATIEVEGTADGMYAPSGFTIAGSPHGPVDVILGVNPPAPIVMTPATVGVEANGTTVEQFNVHVEDLFGNPITGLIDTDFTIAWVQHDSTDSTFVFNTEVGGGDYTFDYTAGVFGPGTDQVQVEYSGETDSSTITVGLPKWHMHIGTQQGDIDLDLVLGLAAHDHGSAQEEAIDVPGVQNTIISTWETAAFGQDTDVSGTWTFELTMWEDNDAIVGRVYPVIKAGASTIHTGTGYSTDLANSAASISWTETVTGTVSNGEQIFVEYWFDASAGGSDSSDGTVYINATAATEILTKGTDSTGTQAAMGYAGDSGSSNSFIDTASSGVSTDYYADGVYSESNFGGTGSNAQGSPDLSYATSSTQNAWLFTAGTTWGGGSGTITKVEMAVDWTLSGNGDDVIKYELIVLGSGTMSPIFESSAASGTQYVDLTNDPFVASNMDGNWDWTDIGNLKPGVRFEQRGASWDGGTLNVDAIWIRVTVGSDELDVQWQYDLSSGSDPTSLYIDATWDNGDDTIAFQISDTGAWGGEETTVATIGSGGGSLATSYAVTPIYDSSVYVRAFVTSTGGGSTQTIHIDKLYFITTPVANVVAGAETIVEGVDSTGAYTDMGVGDDGNTNDFIETTDMPGVGVNQVTDGIFNSDLSNWPIEVLTLSQGSFTWNGATATADGSGSLQGQTNTGKKMDLDGYRGQNLATPIPASTAYTLKFNYSEAVGGRAPQGWAWSIIVEYSDATIATLFTDTTAPGVTGAYGSFTPYTDNTLTVPAGKTLDQIRVDIDMTSANNVAAWCGVRVDDIELLVAGASTYNKLDVNWTYDLTGFQDPTNVFADIVWSGGDDALNIEWSNGDDGSWAWNNIDTLLAVGESVNSAYPDIPAASLNYDNDVYIRVWHAEGIGTNEQTVQIDQLYFTTSISGTPKPYQVHIGYDSSGDGYDSWVQIPQCPDTLPPETSVDTIGTYWSTTTPLAITGTETSANADYVELWYRYSATNQSGSWSAWAYSGILDNTPASISWSFDFTSFDGPGFYEFYSLGFDPIGGWEEAPATTDALCGFDDTNPTSTTDTIVPYWVQTPTVDITFSVNDTASGSGVESVLLYARWGTLNTTPWEQPWAYMGAVNAPFQWVDFPMAEGFYVEFYSLAVDYAGRAEPNVVAAETLCAYDATAPSSSVDAIPSYTQSSSPLSLSASASDSMSGVKDVTLWYRYSTDNSTWSPDWAAYNTDTTGPWDWSFNYPDGQGYYEFYSVATDNAGVVAEADPVGNVADTECQYLVAGPGIQSVTPNNGASNVVESTSVSVEYDMAMDPGAGVRPTITQTAGTVVAYTWAGWSAGNTIATWTHPDWDSEDSITLEVSGGQSATAVPFVGTYSWSFGIRDYVAPTVQSTVPANSASDVLVGQDVVVTFDEAMNPGVEPTLVQSAGTVVVYTFSGWSVGNTVATWTHPDWSSEDSVTLEVSGAEDDSSNTMVGTTSWSFTIEDVVAPTVQSTVPVNSASGVLVGQDVVVTFDEAMNPGVEPTLVQSAGTVVVYTFSGWSVGNTVATWTHPDWSSEDSVTLEVSGAEDDSSNTMVGTTSWSFTIEDVVAPTVQSTVPANSASDVLVGQDVVVTFDEAMNPAVEPTLVQSAGTVVVYTFSGWSVGNTVATWTHPDWTSGDAVTLEVSGAEDDSSNTMVGTTSWSFDIQDIIGPTVQSTVPANSASDVLVGQDVSVTYDMAMDPGAGVRPTLAQTAGTVVAYTWAGWSAGNTIATWTHPDWDSEDSITLEVSGGQSATAVPFVGTTSWSFGIEDVVAPTVQSTVPVNSASDVPVDQDVVVTFDEAMNPGVEPTLVQSAGTVVVYTFSGWSAGNTVATWTHPDWTGGDAVTLEVSGAEDDSSNTMVGTTSWSFDIVAVAVSDTAELVTFEEHWNVFALPLHNVTQVIMASDIKAMVEGAGGSVGAITRWVPGSGYAPAYTGNPSNDFQLDVGHGYWLYLMPGGGSTSAMCYGLTKTDYDTWDTTNGASSPYGDGTADGAFTVTYVPGEFNLVSWFADPSSSLVVGDFIILLDDTFIAGARGFVVYWDTALQDYGPAAIQLDDFSTSQSWMVQTEVGYWTSLDTLTSVTY